MTSRTDRVAPRQGVVFDAAAVRVPGPDGGSRTILHPVTLALAEARVAVVGANGSGKSTLARLVNGLVEPTSGTVSVGGLDTVRDGAAVRRRVGFVLTDPDAQIVMPTPLEDVALSLRRAGVPRGERDARAREVLARFGLADRAEVSVHALSGGQKQLLALAAVLATEPQVLVCDEPTTLLDLRWRARVDELLAGLEQQVLLVTHDLEAAARADRVLVVDEGRVVFDGTPHEGVASYRQLMEPDGGRAAHREPSTPNSGRAARNERGRDQNGGRAARNERGRDHAAQDRR